MWEDGEGDLASYPISADLPTAVLSCLIVQSGQVQSRQALTPSEKR